MAKLRNRVTEKDIRDWLGGEGYDSRSAKFEELELHAIKSPGWVQIFRFQVRVNLDDAEERETLFGVVRDDERANSNRSKTRVCLFSSEAEQTSQLVDWSQGMITIDRSKRNQDSMPLLVMAGLALLAFSLVYLVFNLLQFVC